MSLILYIYHGTVEYYYGLPLGHKSLVCYVLVYEIKRLNRSLGVSTKS